MQVVVRIPIFTLAMCSVPSPQAVCGGVDIGFCHGRRSRPSRRPSCSDIANKDGHSSAQAALLELLPAAAGAWIVTPDPLQRVGHGLSDSEIQKRVALFTLLGEGVP